MTLIECFTQSHMDNMAACLRLRPEKVIFVGTAEEMSAPVKRYREVLRWRGQATKVETENVAGKDVGQICKALYGLIRQEQECVIDITGGDEPVILAVGAVLVNLGREDFQRVRVEKYDHRTGVVRDCIHGNKPVGSKILNITVEELIALHGGSIYPEAIRPSEEFTLDRLNELWEIASGDPRKWNEAVAWLNEFESRADSKQQVYIPLYCLLGRISRLEEKEEAVRALLDRLDECGAVINESTPTALAYTYTSTLARYCTLKAGNVLELKTLLEGQAALEGGAPMFRHCRMSVSIDWDGEIHKSREVADTRNEVDVVLMHGSTPLFISCKNGGVEEVELYKLNEVAERFGGPYAKKMLIVTDLNRGKGNKAFEQRAWDMDIFLVTDAASLSSREWRERFKKALQ